MNERHFNIKKKILAGIVILVMLLSNVFIFQVSATSTWSRARPSSYTVYDETVGSSKTDGLASIGMGVHISDHIENTSTIDYDDEMHETHLTKAIHSELGDVKELLLHDDNSIVDLSPSQTIDLKFTLPNIDEVAYFIFEINCHNKKDLNP